jgi:predicted O-methyltransferase YrrM
MSIERALSVQGWMTEEELSYLASVASKSNIVAEVGSWMGRSTCALAANIGSGSVYAVDTWKGSQEHVPMLAGKPDGWLFSEFSKNTAGLPILPIPLPSLDAAFLLAKTTIRFDLIFIDANHYYESVKADIQAWMPLLTKEGILCGHDFDRTYWPGIVRAVEECIPAFHVVPNTTIWSTEAV